MTKTYCDLCCEEIKTGEKLRFFKIKEYGLFHQLTWQKIDAHDECVKAIAAVAREKGASNDESRSD